MVISELLTKIKHYYPSDYERIMRAYEFANEAHKGQRRVSGEPYIVHPCGVTDILIDLGLDVDTVCASFLHDVVEDTNFTAGDIKREFGENVAELVDGVTKLDKIIFSSKEEEQAENFRKMFLAMAKDIRVLLIKLADRLHNMRTASVLDQDRRIALARETLDIYAPLASRLGISYVKCELEDLCLKILHPIVHAGIVEELNQSKQQRLIIVNQICTELRDMLKELNIAGEVSGRPKHLYSIYRKMCLQKKSFQQIYDLTAVRVVVETVSDCYEVMGRIHTMWKPIPGRFKDYIAVPKPNDYQSLHTTVMTNYGTPFEIQIRTFDMHKIAEFGIAAHWMYKENKTAIQDFDKKINWLRKTLDTSRELANSTEFLESLKIDLYPGQVFVFTPKGDVLVLPEGSTPVDFAYSVHSDVGNKCVSAKINNKLVPLATKLATGDYVEILTSNASKGPSRDWLKFVMTGGAKSKIRAFFKKSMHEDNIKLGKDILEQEAKRKGYTLNVLFQPKYLEQLYSRLSMSSADDIYSTVGYGGITSGQILPKLIELYKKENEQQNKVIKKETTAKEHSGAGILVKGYDGFMVRVAKCCTPVPGDGIIGFVSRGRGIAVHRQSCPNIKGMEQDRLIEVSWGEGSKGFSSNIQIVAADSQGLVAKITAMFSEQKLTLSYLNARLNKAKDAQIDIGVSVETNADVDAIIKKLEMIPDVKYARRQ